MPLIALIGLLQTPPVSTTYGHARPPQIKNLKTLFRSVDYPREASAKGEGGIVSALLKVTSTGSVASCDVTDTSSSRSLDQKTCEVLKSKAKFDPALNDTGTAIGGDYWLNVPWMHVGRSVDPGFYYLTVPVLTLPAWYASPISIVLVSDDKGHLKHCSFRAGASDHAAEQQICNILSSQVVFPVPHSPSPGVQAAGVRTASVTLRLK